MAQNVLGTREGRPLSVFARTTVSLGASKNLYNSSKSRTMRDDRLSFLRFFSFLETFPLTSSFQNLPEDFEGFVDEGHPSIGS